MLYLYLLGGILLGGSMVYFYMKDTYELTFEWLLEREKRAFREAGKLSKIIHRQRLMINELKKNQIPQPKKAYVPQPTVSH